MCWNGFQRGDLASTHGDGIDMACLTTALDKQTQRSTPPPPQNTTSNVPSTNPDHTMDNRLVYWGCTLLCASKYTEK